MAGQRCLERNLCGLLVPDLANHQYIRVLSQNRTENKREGQAYLFIDLDLVDPGQFILHRVFNRNKVGLIGLDLTHAAIKG